MFYTNKVVFVHVPRTGGTVIADWAYRTLNASVDNHFLKHASYGRLIEEIPELGALEAFSISRDTTSILQSYYCHAVSFGGNHSCYGVASLVTNEWVAECNRLRGMSFNEYEQSGCTIMSQPYYEVGQVREFTYENPHVAVFQWLRDVHGLSSE